MFGATGFTGSLIVDELTRAAQASKLRFAIAGRDGEKLRQRSAELRARFGLEVPVHTARADDPAALAAVARSARVVLSAVGPYARHGEPIVRAAIEAGADYLDITGEPDFVAMTIDRYGDAAARAGVRMVSACGFDSVPHDLGVFFLVQELASPSGLGRLAVEGYVHASGSVSGGTWQSMLDGFSRLRSGDVRGLPREPSERRRQRGVAGRPKFVPEVSGWVLPFPSIDPQIVLRSASLIDAYGTDFSYGHFFRAGSIVSAAKLAAGLGAVVGLSQLDATRGLLSRLRPAGEGPPPGVRARAFFRVTLVGHSDDESIQVRVSGGDGYEETARMVVESARCLTEDRAKLPPRVGALTPAAAFGGLLVARLNARGTRFEVVRRTRTAPETRAGEPAAVQVGGAA